MIGGYGEGEDFRYTLDGDTFISWWSLMDALLEKYGFTYDEDVPGDFVEVTHHGVTGQVRKDIWDWYHMGMIRTVECLECALPQSFTSSSNKTIYVRLNC